MNQSIAITIMNDIINSSNNDEDILNRTQTWISILNINSKYIACLLTPGHIAEN